MPDPTRDQLLDAAFVVVNLAELVQEKLIRERLTTVDVAHAADVDRGNLVKFLRGQRGLTAATALKLINWLSEGDRRAGRGSRGVR